MSKGSNVTERMRELLVFTEEEIRKLREKMESYRPEGALQDFLEVWDTQRRLHNAELLRDRILYLYPQLDSSRSPASEPARIPLC